MSFTYKAGYNFQEVFKNFRVTEARGERIKKELLSEGYTERGICYAATKAEDKLLRFIDDSRFDSVFKNEVRKYALKPGDPKWRKNGM